MIKKVNRDLVYDFAIKYFPNFNRDNGVFNNNIAYYDGEIIIGFLSYSVIYERAEIEYIAVDENYRRKGIADELVSFLINDLGSCDSISLEVREDNIIAINLYLKHGFRKVSVRKNYYFDCDGILMIRN